MKKKLKMYMRLLKSGKNTLDLTLDILPGIIKLKVDTTFKSDIENLELLLPDKKTQGKIVAILSSIDEKIKQNNEINNNLAA